MSLITKALLVRRGDVWLVDFNPSIGSEMAKARPAVVVSSDSMGVLEVKIVVPITTWQDKFARSPWLVKIGPTPENGLDHESAADALQARCASTIRFTKKLGFLSADALEEIAAAIAAVVEYQ